MNQLPFALRTITISGLLVLVSSLASAQATRTWVSGVGDDANPCSRTAPCKTFAGAISKTAPGGEINCLDPGGFGAVTITKALTIDGNGTHASILASSTTGVIVNAGVNDVVTLRNLSINGGTPAQPGLDGIRYIGGAALNVENCVIFNFSQEGIDAATTAAGTFSLLVKDTVFRNNGGGSLGSGIGGIQVHPGAGSNIEASIDGCRFVLNRQAVRIDDRATVVIRDSSASRQFANVFNCVSTAAAAKLSLENCLASNNNFTASVGGVRSSGASATVRLSNCTIYNNALGVVNGGGAILSHGNNRISGNTTDLTGTLTPIAPLQQ